MNTNILKLAIEVSSGLAIMFAAIRYFLVLERDIKFLQEEIKTMQSRLKNQSIILRKIELYLEKISGGS